MTHAARLGSITDGSAELVPRFERRESRGTAMTEKDDWPSQWLSTARDEMTLSRHGLGQREERGEEGEDRRMELNVSTASAWVWCRREV